MPVDWDELRKEMIPLKDFEDMRRRWREAFAFPFVQTAYNFRMPQIAAHTRRLLEEDTRGRYADYAQSLTATFDRLRQAGVRDVMDIVGRVDGRGQFEQFIGQAGLEASGLIAALKFLVYWFIPSNKYLSGLVGADSPLQPAIRVLRGQNIRTSLDILQQGLTRADRKALAEKCDLPEAEINELLNRADLSRMPWASKATISNIIGAGYGSLAQLAAADYEQVYRDFFRYGASIEKNLKLGNEIDNSHRIARLMPVVLEG